MIEDYSVVMPFIDQSETYTLGFECGQIFSDLDKEIYTDHMVHRKSIEQIRLIADYFECDCDIKNTSIAEWVEIKIFLREKIKPRLNVVK